MTHLLPLRIDPDALKLAPLELDPKAFQSPLPVQNYHLIFEDTAIGMAVGIWDTTTMQEAFGPYPGDEFITVLEGRFAIVDSIGAAVIGSAGQSATFRDGIPVSWKQDGYLRKIYLTLLKPGATSPKLASAKGGVIVLDGKPAIGGPGAMTQAPGRVIFQNDSGTMTVEHRAHPDLSLPAEPAEAHELCRILAGQIVLTDHQGTDHRFGANDHFFLPKGAVVARKIAQGTETYHVLVKA